MPTINERLEQLAAGQQEILRRTPESPPKPSAPSIGPEPVSSARSFPVGALIALRGVLKPVPDGYWKRRYGARDVLVACRCREAVRFTRVGFHECSCGRVFAWSGRHVLVVPLEA